MSMTCRPMWPFLPMCVSRDKRHKDFSQVDGWSTDTLVLGRHTHPKPCLDASQYTVYPSCPDGSVRTRAEVNFRFRSSKLC